MNLNNLQDLKEQMKTLGFGQELINQMEEQMKKDVANFKLYDTMDASRGQVDLTLHFKQSGQSDYYYLNKFDAAHHQGKPLPQGHKYMVIVLKPEGQKNEVMNPKNLLEAIELFRNQEGNCELASGKDAANRTALATMEAGTVNFVEKEFQRSYYGRPLPQTFWLDRGKGFNREQAGNLVQGRAVFRDDLLSREGVPYKAWMQLDNERERDRQNNLNYKQFTGNYGFTLREALEKFDIKEMADPKLADKLEQELQNGKRVSVTVLKDGQEVKLSMETAVRWGKLNFYNEKGAPEKREQFEKNNGTALSLDRTQQQDKGKGNSQEVSISR